MISLEGSVIGISSFLTHIGMYVCIILCGGVNVRAKAHVCVSQLFGRYYCLRAIETYYLLLIEAYSDS